MDLRTLIVVLAVPLGPSLSHAQPLAASRFQHLSVAHPVLTLTNGAIAPSPQDSRPRAPFAGQVLAGVGGFIGGAVALGVASGAIGYIASGGEDKNMQGAFAWGAIAGALAGPTIGVHWYGRRHGVQSKAWATVLGSTIGVLGGPVAPLTMPIGATIGYNAARSARTAQP